jgi:hypothetical protein
MAAQDGRRRRSRRAVVRAIGGRLATLLALRGWSATRAKDVTSEGVPPLVQAWIDAWKTGDPATNLAAAATFLSGFVQAFSNLDMQLRAGFGTSEHAMAE